MFELFPIACHGCLFIALHAMSVISCQFFFERKILATGNKKSSRMAVIVANLAVPKIPFKQNFKKKRDSAIKSLRKWTLKNGNLNWLQMV